MIGPGVLLSDRYRLVRRIGVGGFSEVWEAADCMARDMAVAVKIYAPLGGMDDRGVERFRDEFTVVMGLNHPHLLTARHFDVWEGRPYLILPLITGGSLDEYLREMGRLAPEEVARMLVQMGSALDHLHARDVLHRDLKPENILRSEDGHLYLTDFGISSDLRQTLQRHTTTRATSLTLAFAAPESFHTYPAGLPASDVFSLGVVAHELATGDLPWQGRGGLALQHGAPLPDMEGLSSAAPLRRLIRSMLSLDPAKRPSAGSVAGAAGAYLTGEALGGTGNSADVTPPPRPTLPLGAWLGESATPQAPREAPEMTRRRSPDPTPPVGNGQVPDQPPSRTPGVAGGVLLLAGLVVALVAVGGGLLWSLMGSGGNGESVTASVQVTEEVEGEGSNGVEGPPGESEDTESPGDSPEAEGTVHGDDTSRQTPPSVAVAGGSGSAPPPASSPPTILSATEPPSTGTHRLESGFLPDPHRIALPGGGPDAATPLGPGCGGFVLGRQPGAQIAFSAGSLPLQMAAHAEGGATLVVQEPGGGVRCDVGSGAGGEATLSWDGPESGSYLVWVGHPSRSGEILDAELAVSEMARGVGFREVELDPEGSPASGQVRLTAGFAPDPRTLEVRAGGGDPNPRPEPGCVGHVQAAGPTAILVFEAGALPLTISATGENDLHLVIRTPDGAWVCDDDSGDGLDPLITLNEPTSGSYAIWVGTWSATEDLVDGVLAFSELGRQAGH